MQDDAQQRAVYFDISIIFDEAELAKLVHEVTDTRARRADHLGQGLLIDLGNDDVLFSFFPVIRHQQENARQALFTGIEQMIDQLLFKLDVLRQKISENKFGKICIVMKRPNDGGLLQARDDAVGNRGGGRNAQRVLGEAFLSTKVACFQHGHDRLFAVFGHDRQFDLALGDIKDGVGGVALGVEKLTDAEAVRGRSAVAGREGHGIEGALFSLNHHRSQAGMPNGCERRTLDTVWNDGVCSF